MNYGIETPKAVIHRNVAGEAEACSTNYVEDFNRVLGRVGSLRERAKETVSGIIRLKELLDCRPKPMPSTAVNDNRTNRLERAVKSEVGCIAELLEQGPNELHQIVDDVRSILDEAEAQLSDIHRMLKL